MYYLNIFKEALEAFRAGKEVVCSSLWGDRTAESEDEISAWFDDFELGVDVVEVLYSNEYGFGLYFTSEEEDE